MPEIDVDAPFRGWVRHGTEFAIRDLALKPRRPHEVVIKNMAAQACYTIVENVSTLPNHQERAKSPGHGAMGIVVEVGPQVRRVQVGDRVVTPVTPSCGTCYSCVRGEWYACGHKNGRRKRKGLVHKRSALVAALKSEAVKARSTAPEKTNRRKRKAVLTRS